MNVIAPLKLELAYYNVAVEHVDHNTTGESLILFQVFLSNTNNLHSVVWIQVSLSNTNYCMVSMAKGQK